MHNRNMGTQKYKSNTNQNQFRFEHKEYRNQIAISQ